MASSGSIARPLRVGIAHPWLPATDKIDAGIDVGNMKSGEKLEAIVDFIGRHGLPHCK